ncbi:MAG TPA: hypothetical protein VNK05_08800 [Chloroflexota bacterium]|nr:hypothetical protein [Chloroflexota bacterium]
MSQSTSRPFVAIQIGAVSFVDEGVPQVLDVLQERAGVNALLLANPTWTRGTGGRQVPGQPFPDHGVQAPDDFRGGAYNRTDPRWYGKTAIAAAYGHTDPEIPAGFDLFEAVLPEAQRRGVRAYAWMEESSTSRHLHAVPSFTAALEVDVWGRPSNRPCFRHPDYRWWIRGRMEDYARNWPLAGIVWCSERTGPLNHLIGNRNRYVARDIACFCEHCRAAFRERGYDPRRGIAGYQALYDWYERAGRGERPSDGYFTTFWRHLLTYPELLAWERLWSDGQHQLSREIYGTVKAADPRKEVGVHVYHELSFSPWYRAEEDYADLKRYHDWLKPVIYNNCAGPRFGHFVANLCRSLFGDATPAEVYPLMLRLLNLEEAPFEEIATAGFSADYVRRETERAVQGVNDEIPIYPGIDIDIPTEADESKCTPEGVRDAVKGAFAGGAGGVVLSRKYSEMRLDNLAGAGQALRDLGYA